MNICRYINAFMHPVTQYRWLFIFTFLMCLAIAFIGNYVGDYSTPFLAILLPIFDCYIACLLAVILGKIRLSWFVYICSILFLFSELFTTIFYHSHFNINVIRLILETNQQESTEFIQSVILQPSNFQSIAITAAIAIISCLLSRISYRKIPYKRVFFYVAFVLIAWSGIRQVSAYKKLTYLALQDGTSEFGFANRMPHLDTPFIRITYSLLFNIASSNELDILENSVAHTQIDSCVVRCPLIVLVIGESYNKHHTPLYNPQYRNTTPRLKTLHDIGNLVIYNNVVTPHNLTSVVFREMFSTWDESCNDSWAQHTLFPAVFRKAGYNVHFISNQFIINTTDFWDTIGGTIFNRPKLSELQFTSRNTHSYLYDGDLLKELPTIDSLLSAPTLLIVHLYGQHVNYAVRYPAEFASFNDTDCTIQYGGNQGKEICNHYDNATFYNDYVVDSIFKTIAQTDAIAIYLADHGEEVYDWRNKFERTRDMTPEVAHFQYEIPFMFYMTDIFMKNHPEITDAVRSSADRPFISNNLCHMLFSLAGIRTSEYKAELDLLSPGYNSKPKRIINKTTDYDEIIKELKTNK